MTPDRPTLRPSYAAPSLARGPWTLSALLALVGADLVVVGLLVTAWYRAAQESTPQQQIGWVDLGGVAFLLAFGVHTGWLVAGRRAIGVRSRALAPAAADLLDPLDPQVESATPSVDDQLVRVGERMTLFHLAGCPLLAGRDTDSVAVSDALDRGLLPCSMCGPT